MRGAYKYLDRIYYNTPGVLPPKYSWSKVFYVSSRNAAISQNNNLEGALAFYIHSIQWTTTSAVGTLATFTLDGSTVILNQVYDAGSTQLWQRLDYPIKDSSMFNITCSDGNATFIVSYQFIATK